MIVRDLACSCCLVLLLSHCGDDATDVAAPVNELSLVTFNAALGVGLAPYLEPRLDAIQRDLPDLGADVVCLQEVWQPENIERLESELGGVFPFSHHSVQATGAAGGVGGAACSDAEASLLSSCLSDNCGEVEPAALPLCAISNCAASFTQVSPACQECIAANQSAQDVANLATICGSADSGAVSYADQTGLLILSRLPLEALGYLELDSSLGDRGVLSARVQTAFMGAVDLHCTHLAASLGEVPYTGPYGSWQGERLRQIDQMLERVEATREDAGAAILLGDMNCGPGTPLAEPASPDAFGRFVAAGFQAPYADADGRCTFCSNNPLNGLTTDPEQGALIDHVLVSADVELGFSATRVLDEPIVAEDGGGPVTTAHSDHYGVRVQVSAAAAGAAPQ